ncbi:MAG: DUF4349 domain-containing protein [Chitinophagaceae bacterium]
MKSISQLVAAMLLWVLFACNNKESVKQIALLNKDIASANETKMEYPAGDLITGDSTAAPGNNQRMPTTLPAKVQASDDWDKKIIKTGNLTLEVKNYQAFNELMHTAVKKSGGYIGQEEQVQSDYKVENSVTVMVPVDQFDNAVNTFTQGTEKVIERKITSDDVTGQIMDTKSRMEAKKKVRDRYLDLLKQAKNMEEILQVQNEVNGIQENIEAAAGRIGYLAHASAFSTLHIRFYQVLSPAPANDPNPSYSSRVMESFKSGLHWFTELFIILVSLWPVWTGMLIAWFFIRKWKAVPAKSTRQVS